MSRPIMLSRCNFEVLLNIHISLQFVSGAISSSLNATVKTHTIPQQHPSHNIPSLDNLITIITPSQILAFTALYAAFFSGPTIFQDFSHFPEENLLKCRISHHVLMKCSNKTKVSITTKNPSMYKQCLQLQYLIRWVFWVRIKKNITVKSALFIATSREETESTQNVASWMTNAHFNYVQKRTINIISP